MLINDERGGSGIQMHPVLQKEHEQNIARSFIRPGFFLRQLSTTRTEPMVLAMAIFMRCIASPAIVIYSLSYIFNMGVFGLLYNIFSNTLRWLYSIFTA